MKCARCGKGIGMVRRGQAIADGYVCYKCLDDLGFSKTERGIKRWPLSYWEIKNGKSRINETRAAYKKAHQEWMNNNPDVAAFLAALDGDDEEAEKSEDTGIDEA